jgi:hypothetical protein
MNKEQDKADALIKGSIDGGRKWTELLVDTGGAIAGLTAGFSALKGAADIWNDDTLTPWEQFKGMISGLIAAAPALVLSFKSLKGVLSDQKVKITALNIVQAINNKLHKENTEIQKENTVARDANNDEI